MSLQSITQANCTPWTQYGVSSANAPQTLTIAADTTLIAGFANSVRQIICFGIWVWFANATATPVAASAILTITTTGFQGTPTFPVANGFAAWSVTQVLSLYMDSPYGGMAVPLVGGGAAQNPATIVIPAGGAGMVSYASAVGVYI